MKLQYVLSIGLGALLFYVSFGVPNTEMAGIDAPKWLAGMGILLVGYGVLGLFRKSGGNG